MWISQNAEDQNSALISVSGLVFMQVNCCCTCHTATFTVHGTVLLRCSVHLTIKAYLRAVISCFLGKTFRRFGGKFYLHFEDIIVKMQA